MTQLNSRADRDRRLVVSLVWNELHKRMIPPQLTCHSEMKKYGTHRLCVLLGNSRDILKLRILDELSGFIKITLKGHVMSLFGP
jgi:hypothetical protein